jgi:EmrB/QacA subfamily drug resistance transporter
MDTQPTRAAWNVFALAATGAFITTLDLSIVNVAFAEIAKTYAGASRADIAWVVTAYNIMFASLLVAGGKTADRIGRKRVFLWGSALFGVGSIMCAVSPTLQFLVAGRVVQGIGGAFLTPASLGLLLGAFPPERRTQVVSLSGAVGALGVASGPTLGALLISVAGWRAAFWLNIPIVLTVVAIGIRVLRESERESNLQRPDYMGAVMITAALAAIALAISQSQTWGWSDGRIIVSLVVFSAVVPLFIRRQQRHPEPIVDLSLFRERHFTIANLATLLFMIAFSSMLLNNVLFLRTVWKYSVLQAGMASCLAPITVAFVSTRAGVLARRFGFRPLLIGGPVLFATAALCDLVLLSSTRTIVRWLVFGFLQGCGIGFTLPILSSSAVSTLAANRFAVGGAINSTARQVGSVLGVALLVAVQGRAKGTLAVFDHGWMMVIVAGLASTALSTMQPRRSHVAATPRPAGLRPGHHGENCA